MMPGRIAAGDRPGLPGWLLWSGILICHLYPLFLFPIHNPNERVRIYMTAAMVEHGTFAIGYRSVDRNGRTFHDRGSVTDRWGYVNDKALACYDPEQKPPVCDGALYSAKAPGSSYLGYPFYAALYWLSEALERPLTMEGAILYLRLFVIVLPTLLMLWLFRRYARVTGVPDLTADLVTMAIGLGSMVYTYSHMFAGHQLATALLFFCFYAAWRGRGPDRAAIWPLLSGACAGMAVCTEYPMALAAFPLFIYQVCVRRRVSTLPLFVLGALPAAIMAGWFHVEAFGGVLATPYSALENPQFVKDIAPGFMGLRAPSLRNLIDSFVAPYEGMFYFAPWTGLAVLLTIAAFFRRPPDREREASAGDFPAAAAVLLALTLFIACHSLWRGGWTLGPRYIVPFVPFAGVALMRALGRFPEARGFAGAAVLLFATVVSVAVTGACSLVSQGFHTAFFNPFAEAALPLLAGGYVTYNLGNALGLQGPASAAPVIAAALALAAGATWRVAQSASAPGSRPFARGRANSGPAVVRVCCLAAACSIGVWSLTLPQKRPSAAVAKAYAFTRDNLHVFSAASPEAERLEHGKNAAAAFRNHPGIQVLRLHDLTHDGLCKESLFAGRQLGAVLGNSTSAHVLVGAMGALSPLPTVLHIPSTVLPDLLDLQRR